MKEFFDLKILEKRVHQALFWPLINSETEDMIKDCLTCLTFRNRKPSEPAINQPRSGLISIAWTLLFIGSRL